MRFTRGTIRAQGLTYTCKGQQGDRERSRAAGCDGHLVKPVNLSDLQKLLTESRG